MKAIIFDLDGTILDNEAAYGAAFKAVLESLGAKVQANHPHQAGIGVQENWPILLSKYHLKTDQTLKTLTQATQNQYLKHASQIRLAAGVLELISRLKAEGWQIALATSNAWWLVEKELEQFNLEDKFDTVTTIEEVANNKPAPDLFLETAKKLDTDPQNCVVVEDSVAGIKAAKTAGMKSIAITSSYHSQADFQTASADLVVPSFSAITPKLLHQLTSD